MTESEVFLQEIIANPDDDLPRLVFADWLEEHGDPRGEFIRVQCALANTPFDAPEAVSLGSRETALLEKYRKSWTVGIRKFVRVYEFRRGFVERVTFNAKRSLAKADDLFSLAPIRDMKVRELSDLVAEFSQGAFLERLTHLNLTSELGARGCVTFLKSPRLGTLEFLNLSHNMVGLTGIRTLAQCDGLKNLKSLILNGNDIDELSFAHIAEIPLIGQLRELQLSMNQFGDNGIRMLCRRPEIRNIEEIGLTYCGLTDTGVRFIAESPYWENLKKLRLCDSDIGEASMLALAASSRMKTLRSLMIGGIPISITGLRALGESPYLSQLDELFLYGRGNDEVADVLLDAPNFRRLRTLDVHAAVLGHAAKRRLRKRKVDTHRPLGFSEES